MVYVMELNAAIRCPFDAGDFPRVMKRPAERGDGIPNADHRSGFSDKRAHACRVQSGIPLGTVANYCRRQQVSGLLQLNIDAVEISLCEPEPGVADAYFSLHTEFM